MDSNHSTKPRTVIITGSNKGIGYQTIEILLKSGTSYNIILCARSQQNGDKAVAQLKEKYSNTISTITPKQLDLDNTTSVDSFVDWVKTELKSYDVLINNAAILPWSFDKKDLIQTLVTNFINTVTFTEKVLPYLSDDGKIISISSTMGSVAFQGKKARTLLEDPTITTERLVSATNSVIEYLDQGKNINEIGYNQNTYQVSKALLNAYVRFVLTKKLKPTQQAYSVCPGWCQTDLGGPKADRTAEKGAETPAWLVDLPFTVDEKLSGKFVRDQEVIAWDDTQSVNPRYNVLPDY